MILRFSGLMRTSILLLLASLAVLTISISHVHASMVTFKFEGELTSVDSTLSETFSTGDRFTGTYTFDSESSPNEDQDISFLPISTFSNAISEMSFVSGDYMASATNGEISQDFFDLPLIYPSLSSLFLDLL